ncbi:hypothetical protein [Streptomyces sp. H51]|uniref:hypothetical protein n=1 Tax=Streptomyces sp. H51 TaxID=3111770 RepID=UPI002D77C01F|nr:hypothetical protein [Streptomyces sp. H51]
MTARAERRVRHRRRVTGRRAVMSGAAVSVQPTGFGTGGDGTACEFSPSGIMLR